MVAGTSARTLEKWMHPRRNRIFNFSELQDWVKSSPCRTGFTAESPVNLSEPYTPGDEMNSIITVIIMMNQPAETTTTMQCKGVVGPFIVCFSTYNS